MDEGPPPLEEAPRGSNSPSNLPPPKFVRRWTPGGTVWLEGPGFETAKEEMRNATTEEEKIQAARKLVGFMIILRPKCELVPYSKREEETPE